jgi:hypothetical protein
MFRGLGVADIRSSTGYSFVFTVQNKRHGFAKATRKMNIDGAWRDQ